MIFVIYLFSIIFCQFPYQINSLSNHSSQIGSDGWVGGLNSNHVINMEAYSDSIIFLGTTNGLHMAYYDAETYQFESILLDSIGGNPALIVKDNVIAVSGVRAISIGGDVENGGTGIIYSIDGGSTWNFIDQSLDSYSQNNPGYTDKFACPWQLILTCGQNESDSLYCNGDGVKPGDRCGEDSDGDGQGDGLCTFDKIGSFDENSLFTDKDLCNETCFDCSDNQRSCSMYDYISWGEQDSILNFSVTTNIHNISYGLDVYGDYIYAASWAGSLRRFDYTKQNPSWEVVPLPMDNQVNLVSNDIDIFNYQINPIGNYVESHDCGFEFDNHKVFSVYIQEINDPYDPDMSYGIIWVGTAYGINKGIINSDNLINWTRMTSQNSGFYDDWVIGFESQILEDGTNRIWAITWDRRYDSSHLVYGGPPSYSDNGGHTWEVIDYLREKKVITYNISTFADKCYVSSDQGLFLSSNSNQMQLWEKISLPDYIIEQSVYDSQEMSRFDDLWVASSPMTIYSNEDINFISSQGNIQDKFYAYPNPFYIDEDLFITFSYNKEERDISGDINIYDFNMDKVMSVNVADITTWDGKNHFGHQVANGVYICEYIHSDNSKNYFNVMVINSK